MDWLMGQSLTIKDDLRVFFKKSGEKVKGETQQKGDGRKRTSSKEHMQYMAKGNKMFLMS